MARNHPDSASTSQSLERGLAILSSFSTDRRLIGVSEVANELGLTRSTAHRYIATLARLGYLHQDPVSREVHPRTACARPRLHGDQLDGAPGCRRASPSTALRRDGTHREHGHPRRRGHRLRRAVARVPPPPERDRPRPPRRLAAARLLHVDGEGAPRVPPRRRAGRAPGPHHVHAPRPEHAHVEGGLARRAPARSRHGYRGEQRGARLRAPLGCRARARPRAAMPSPPSTSPRTGRWRRWTSLSRGSARSCSAPRRRSPHSSATAYRGLSRRARARQSPDGCNAGFLRRPASRSYRTRRR